MAKRAKSAAEDRYMLESLARGINLLEHFSEEESEAGISLKEVADRSGIELTGALRIAHTFEKLGYLNRDPSTKRYTLGPKAVRLGLVALQRLEVRSVSMPHIQALVDLTRETVSLARLFGGQAVVIERIESQHALTVRGRVGWTFPIYSTSLGKVLLAYLPEEQRSKLLRSIDLTPTGPHTITSLTELEAELVRVKEAGFALNDEESAADIRSVAAPIYDAVGAVVASVNVGGPAVRIKRNDLVERLAPRVVETAAAISRDMGYRDHG